jgi:TonB family protein
LIHFDIEQRYQDEAVVGTAISRREGVVLSVVMHATMAALILLLPQLPYFERAAEEQQRLEEARLQAEEREQENPTFVFVRPRADVEAPTPPERSELSDIDRQASAPVVAPDPINPLPLSQGDSGDRVEESLEESVEESLKESEMAAAVPQLTPPAPPDPTSSAAEVPSPLAQAETGYRQPSKALRMPKSSDLGEALRNLERYVQKGSFDNPRGGANQPGAAIQFDSRGVEFGPWIRRFVAQVKRNWFVPNAAWLMKGHVFLQFNIHKDGRISDISVVGPSAIEAFNNAAYNAILTSNPTEPLPPEYPEEQALFTVTFFYNEEAPPY